MRGLARNLVPGAGGGEGEVVQRNATLLGEHFGLSPVETSMLTFVALYKIFDGFEHVVDGALETKEVTVPLLLSWFWAPGARIRDPGGHALYWTVGKFGIGSSAAAGGTTACLLT